MKELTNERIEQILYEETTKKEELSTILRGIYTRYMRLYEQYFADIDALNDDMIAEFRKDQEETDSLVRYYFLDIPEDICGHIKEFNEQVNARLLGPEWHKCLFDLYEDFKRESWAKKTEEIFKAEFEKKALESFYDAMGSVFREGFGTGSKTGENILSGIAGLLFGKQEKKSN